MNPRTLVFVNHPADAGPPDASTDVVVLDATWTPGPGDRPDVVSLRPTLQVVIGTVDLFDGSMARLDAWAATATLADRFMVDGVTWWNRVRMIIRWDVNELILWRHVVALLAPPGRYGTLVIPADRPALVVVARAGGAADVALQIVTSSRPTPFIRRLRGWVRAHVGASIRRRVRGGVHLVRQGSRRRHELARRDAILDARTKALRAQPPDVLAIASARAFQLVRSDGQERFVDPNLAPVLDRLAAEGCRVATIALAIDHQDDADWARVDGDDRLLPHSMVKNRYARPEDGRIDASDVAARVAAVGEIPLDVAGADLGPALHTMIDRYAGTWLDSQRRWTVWAERLLRDLHPRVLFLDREGSRTLWMAAARRLGIPIVAVQHGIIYPNNPEYCFPAHPGALLPETTCVFGTYERDVLIQNGPFEPDQVLVTGSARSNPDGAGTAGSPEERADVRSELGIADRDRMLVISVGNNPVGGDLHSVAMVARVLDGPLPGVHLVIKLHPIDRTKGRYEALMAGLARAGGYPAPPLTVVRDIDLYRLLRAADAHLGQHSTVLTDAVVVGTPNMLAVGTAYDDYIGHAVAGVAVPVRSVDDVRAFMADPRPPDPDDRARFLAAHFRSGDAVGHIAAALRRAMALTGPEVNR